MNYTDNPFRSSDLGVMSPARCLCAMPVCMEYVFYIPYINMRKLFK